MSVKTGTILSRDGVHPTECSSKCITRTEDEETIEQEKRKRGKERGEVKRRRRRSKNRNTVRK